MIFWAVLLILVHYTYLYKKEAQTDQACENQSHGFEKIADFVVFLYHNFIIMEEKVFY